MKKLIFFAITSLFYLNTRAQYTQTNVLDMNFTNTEIFSTGWQPVNRPGFNYGSGFTFKFLDTRYSGQIFMPCAGYESELYLRGEYNNQWGNWNRIWHSGNVDELKVTELNLSNYWQLLNGGLFFVGNVGIGTSPNTEYVLAANGTIRAKEIKVDSDWADFVFEDNYQLMKLSELEQFIQKNGHLPDIPTEKEVETEGVSLGEMNAKLLQKIEEQTLYILQLQKQLQDVNQRLDKMEQTN